jgi:molybdenum cofactor synthesis domain-containing protein
MGALVSTAAALIIGDEILTGKTRDENTHALAQLLFGQGVDLVRVVVIPDDIPVIVDELKKLSAQHTFVFTSGGIGPTHDDKTYEAVSLAFDRPLLVHEESLARLLANMEKHYPERSLTAARKRMVLLPTPCEIVWTEGLWVPLVVVENVFVLPGIPAYFKAMLEAARSRLIGTPKHRIQIYTQMSEGDIADSLSDTQKKYADVAIGSYPRTSEGNYMVMVSVEGRDRIHVQHAAEEVERATKGHR